MKKVYNLELERFIKGDYIRSDEEKEVKKLALVGVLELGADVEENRLRAKLNKDFVRFVEPTLLDKIDDLILKIGRIFYRK
jgi:hypothetical protein